MAAKRCPNPTIHPAAMIPIGRGPGHDGVPMGYSPGWEMITIRRLRWDQAGLAQVAGHRVTPNEVEEVCHVAPLALQSGAAHPDRQDGRHPRPGGHLAPQTPDVCKIVTARPATPRERGLDADLPAGRRTASGDPRSQRPSRIPNFAGRAEQAAWWDTHDAADYLAELRPVSVRFARQLLPGLTIHLSPDDLTALRSRADAEGRLATNVARDWIQERLDRLRETEPPRKRRR